MTRKYVEAPVFFTSASRVKIPFVGDDTTKIKLLKTGFYPVSNPLERHHNKVAQQFIKSVSGDVAFNIDVVRERSAHMVPFKDAEFHKLFDASDIVHRNVSSKADYSGRFNTRGYLRKVPSHLKKLHHPDSSLGKKTKAIKSKSKKEIPDENLSEREKSSSQASKHGETFLTEITDSSSIDVPLHDDLDGEVLYLSKLPPGARRHRRVTKDIPINDWDELVLDQLSKDTARWIVYENFSGGGKQKEKLDKFIKKKFGPKISNTHLVREEVTESDLDVIAKKRDEAKKQEDEANRILMKEQFRSNIVNDRNLGKTIAQYYKLPRYLKQQKIKDISTSSVVNQTAQSIKVKHLRPSPPPKMQDFLNPNAGQFIRTTDNEFEQQLYTGQAKPVHQKDNDISRIIMDDLSEYRNKLQPKFPPDLQHWTGAKSKKQKTCISRGLHRWTSLPEPADFMSERGLNPPSSENAKIVDIEINHKDQMQDNLSIITIIEEWRSKWRIAGRWQEVTLADVILDMDSIHSHVRLAAVTVCAMAALHRMPVTDIAVLTVFNSMGAVPAKSSAKGHLPDALVAKVTEKLNDKVERVRFAAAMCLYTLSIDDNADEVIEILKNNLLNKNSVDQLAAAQCLALNGSSSPMVIRVLLDLLLGYESCSASASPLVISQRKQATTLLVHISENTRLVHSLLAEQLNSSNWKDRAMSCNVLSKLHGNINKDLVHKLTNLMWNDWSSSVRKAAAQILGKTGHGREIHFQLRDKLLNGNERIRVNVLKVISHLGIMTASLLPAFMKCYQDEYISVRLEACLTTAKLKIADEKILSELIRLMEHDPAWKIKAHAIKALGAVGLLSPKAHDALVWAVRFEDNPGVRMEACAALRTLIKPQEVKQEVIRVLQDRVLVETDPDVKEEVRLTLDAFGMSGPEDNMEMIQQIKNEVKRLSDKGIIASKIAVFEQELEKYENKSRYIGPLKDEKLSRRVSTRNTELQNIQSMMISAPSTAQTRKLDYTPRTQTQSQVKIIFPRSDTFDSMDSSSYESELNLPTTPQETPDVSLPNTPAYTSRKSLLKTPSNARPGPAVSRRRDSIKSIANSLKVTEKEIKSKSTDF